MRLKVIGVVISLALPFYSAGFLNRTIDDVQKNSMLFSGNANKALAQDIARCLDMPLGEATVSTFNDGEIRIQIEENVRNKDIFVIQPTCPTIKQSVNDAIMELCLLVRTFKRASTASITAVIPYYGYARQDRKMKGRVPISAADIAYLLETAGVDRVVTVDLHCGQIQGFFQNIPVDNLYGSLVFAPHIAQKDLACPVVVSPDAGGVERANQFVRELSKEGVDSGFALISKRRAKAGVVDSMQLIGDVNGADAIIIDDMCDTGGTLAHAAHILKEHGARRVFAVITHPVFSGKALDTLGNCSALDEMIVSDTIPLRGTKPENIQIISVASLLADAILCIQQSQSVAELFG